MSAVMYGDQDRALHYAVLFSIALHGALLAVLSALPEPETRAPAPGPILARLVQPAPVAVPSPPPVVAAAPPPVAAPKPEPIKPRAQKKPSAAIEPAAPKPRPSAEEAEGTTSAKREPAAPVAPPSSDAPTPVEEPVATLAPAPPPAAIAGTTPEPAPPSADANDAGLLAKYRLQIISAARKYKRYPRAAMDNNWEGDVVVRMAIGTNGMISALTVRTSSGHEVLDRQALEMFKRAKPLVQIPPGLRGKEFSIELRAIYSLTDQEPS